MNSLYIIFRIFGGLTLFLLGIRMISEQSQKFGRQWLRHMLTNSSQGFLQGIFNGFRGASIMQSGGGVITLIIGLSESMIITLPVALAMGLGANLGTALTGLLLAVKSDGVSLLIIGFGVTGILLGKNEKIKYGGYILLGMGFVFLGMEFMRMGFAPVRNLEGLMLLVSKLNGTDYISIIEGMVLGGIFTTLLGSRLAVTGLVLAFASQGILDFAGCASIILGENLGAIVRIHRVNNPFTHVSNSVKRLKMGISLLNGLGIFIVVILFYRLIELVEVLVPGMANDTVRLLSNVGSVAPMIGIKPFVGIHIAVFYIFINGVTLLSGLIFIRFLPGLMQRIIPESIVPFEMNSTCVSPLKLSYMKNPVLGMMEGERKVIVLAQKAVNTGLIVQDIVRSKKGQKGFCDEVINAEQKIDECFGEVRVFFSYLTSGGLSESDAERSGILLELSYGIKKYADHLRRMVMIFDELDRERVFILDESRANINELFNEVFNFFNISFGAFEEELNSENFLEESREMDRKIRKMVKEAKRAHFMRVRERICNNEEIVYMIDLINIIDCLRSETHRMAERITGLKKSKKSFFYL